MTLIPQPNNSENLMTRIDAILPQTQCKNCGFDGCLAYAQAIVESNADINLCPPGGKLVLQQLATLLHQPELEINPECGQDFSNQVMMIDEASCIGCTKCIQACPVDAIIGIKKYMHMIIPDECTGCELCIPACPMDCILIEKNPFELTAEQRKIKADQSRERFNMKKQRYQKSQRLTETVLPQKIKLAERTDQDKMLDLINFAKQKAKSKDK